VRHIRLSISLLLGGGFKRYSLTAEVLRHNLTLKPAAVNDSERDAVLAPLNDLVRFTLQDLIYLGGETLGDGHGANLCFWNVQRQPFDTSSLELKLFKVVLCRCFTILTISNISSVPCSAYNVTRRYSNQWILLKSASSHIKMSVLRHNRRNMLPERFGNLHTSSNLRNIAMECSASEAFGGYVSYCNGNNLTFVAGGERTKRVTLPDVITHIEQLSCNRTTVTASLICGHEVIQVTHEGENFHVSAVQCAKNMSWTGLLWLQKSRRYLLCCDDGFTASERTADGTELKLSKQKISVASEIGPQNKLFTVNGKSTVEALHGVGETSDDFLILSASKRQPFLPTRHIYTYHDLLCRRCCHRNEGDNLGDSRLHGRYHNRLLDGAHYRCAYCTRPSRHRYQRQ
jgi:hypothetical protein